MREPQFGTHAPHGPPRDGLAQYGRGTAGKGSLAEATMTLDEVLEALRALP